MIPSNDLVTSSNSYVEAKNRIDEKNNLTLEAMLPKGLSGSKADLLERIISDHSLNDLITLNELTSEINKLNLVSKGFAIASAISEMFPQYAEMIDSIRGVIEIQFGTEKQITTSIDRLQDKVIKVLQKHDAGTLDRSDLVLGITALQVDPADDSLISGIKRMIPMLRKLAGKSENPTADLPKP